MFPAVQCWAVLTAEEGLCIGFHVTYDQYQPHTGRMRKGKEGKFRFAEKDKRSGEKLSRTSLTKSPFAMWMTDSTPFSHQGLGQ